MTRNTILLITSLVVVSTAVAGIATARSGATSNNSTSCTCATIDIGSDSLRLVVLVEGNDGGVSTSQQVLQLEDRTRINVNTEFGDESLDISGEDTENGSLAFDVTHNGTEVEEDLVVVPAETEYLVFRVGGETPVSIERTASAPDECRCDTGDSAVDVSGSKEC